MMLVLLCVALSAVERVFDLAPVLNFVLRVLSTEELLWIELKVICYVEAYIFVFVIATWFKLLEANIIGALHH